MSYEAFWVDFVRGKQRARMANGHMFTPQQTRFDMQEIAWAYRQTGGGMAPLGVPVSVHITTGRPMPKSRKGEEEPDVYKPDADNIIKLVLDALNGVAWHDDSQVTRILCDKADRSKSCREPWMHIAVSWEDEEGGKHD